MSMFTISLVPHFLFQFSTSQVLPVNRKNDTDKWLECNALFSRTFKFSNRLFWTNKFKHFSQYFKVIIKITLWIILKWSAIYSQTWANDHRPPPNSDHLSIAATILRSQFDLLYHCLPLNNDHLSTTTTFFRSQGWSLYTSLAARRKYGTHLF